MVTMSCYCNNIRAIFFGQVTKVGLRKMLRASSKHIGVPQVEKPCCRWFVLVLHNDYSVGVVCWKEHALLSIFKWNIVVNAIFTKFASAVITIALFLRRILVFRSPNLNYSYYVSSTNFTFFFHALILKFKTANTVGGKHHPYKLIF
jgi:hypothetical protein